MAGIQSKEFSGAGVEVEEAHAACYLKISLGLFVLLHPDVLMSYLEVATC